MDAGSSPAGSIVTRERVMQRSWRAVPRHALTQHLVPLLGKGHNGDFTLKIGEDSTILEVNEVNYRGEWRIALLVLEDMKSIVTPWHFIVKGINEGIELPENGAWNCVGSVQSRSGYIWAIFQVWPETTGGSNGTIRNA